MANRGNFTQTLTDVFFFNIVILIILAFELLSIVTLCIGNFRKLGSHKNSHSKYTKPFTSGLSFYNSEKNIPEVISCYNSRQQLMLCNIDTHKKYVVTYP